MSSYTAGMRGGKAAAFEEIDRLRAERDRARELLAELMSLQRQYEENDWGPATLRAHEAALDRAFAEIASWPTTTSGGTDKEGTP